MPTGPGVDERRGNHYAKKFQAALLVSPSSFDPLSSRCRSQSSRCRTPGRRSRWLPPGTSTSRRTRRPATPSSRSRGPDSSLSHEETVSTGGLGTSAGLGSQASVAITADGDHLLTVNAGSDDVSIFDVTSGGLELADVQAVATVP